MSEFDVTLLRQIDAICDRFEEQWSTGQCPDWKALLDQIDPSHRERLLEKLLDVDLELRQSVGQTVQAVDYDALGQGAVDYVRVRLQSLTDRPLNSQPTEATGKSELRQSASRQIGPFKLLQRIGEGGMGAVWMANQQKPVRRRVALKVIKAGMDTRQVIARFEAERQALAMMDHQNIAKVLDAGMTDDGRPWFAMELVQGIPINKYCDDNKLTLDQRLELFVPVCHAVQHAHQKGIIHRDLKPSNVLVTLYDGKPVPKVIDFGLAKAMEHTNRLTDRTMFTEFGQVVGTLQYMSPEQAEMNALDVDTRTDIYSLGVMLYELLTGSTPLDSETVKKSAFLEVIRRIKETDPPRPSTRLSESGDAIKGISAQRKIAPSKLQQILRGELDWIVMKALEKDRSRRYETANGFAKDVQRYLDNEPVTARPPSATYRMKKLLAKHKILFGTATVVLAMLIVSLIAISRSAMLAEAKRIDALNAQIDAQAKGALAEKRREEADAARVEAVNFQRIADARALEAEKARARAEKEKAVAEAVRNFLKDKFLKKASVWEQANAQVTGTGQVVRQDVTITELLDDAANEYSPQTIETKFPGEPLVQAEILETIGDAFSSLEEHQRAVEFIKTACQIRKKAFDEASPFTAQGRVKLYFATVLAKDYQTAAVVLNLISKSAVDAYIVAANSEAAGDPPEVVAARLQEAEVLTDATIDEIERRMHPSRLVMPSIDQRIEDLNVSVALNVGKAIQNLIRLDEILVSRYGESVRRVEYVRFYVSVCYFALGEKQKSLEIMERTLEWVREEYGEDNVMTAGAELVLAVAYDSNGHSVDQRLPLLQHSHKIMTEVMSAEHPTTLVAATHLADALETSGDLESAVKLREQVVNARFNQLGIDHPTAYDGVESLTIDYRQLGQHDKAVEIARDFYHRSKQELGPGDFRTFQAMEDYAYCLNEAGNKEDGIALYQQLIASCKQEFGEVDPDTLHFVNLFGNSLFSIGEYEMAHPLYSENLKNRRAVHGDQDPRTLVSISNLAGNFRELGEFDRAIELYKEAIEGYTASSGPLHVDTLENQAKLAKCLLLSQQHELAIDEYQRLVQRGSRKWGSSSATVTGYRENLAIALYRSGAFDSSREIWEDLVNQEREALASNRDRSPKKLATLLANVANSLLKLGEAESALAHCKECLDLRQRVMPDDWRVPVTKSLLGECYLQLNQLDDAGRLLKEAYAEFEKRRSQVSESSQNSYLSELCRRLVAWSERTGNEDDTRKWREQLAKLDQSLATDE